jgi:hypothetical protein
MKCDRLRGLLISLTKKKRVGKLKYSQNFNKIEHRIGLLALSNILIITRYNKCILCQGMNNFNFL